MICEPSSNSERCRQPRVSPRRQAGLLPRRYSAVIHPARRRRRALQGPLEPLGETGRYALAEHLKPGGDAGQLGHSKSDQVREGATGWVTDQPSRPHAQVGHSPADQPDRRAAADRRPVRGAPEAGVPPAGDLAFRTVRSFGASVYPLVEAGLIRANQPDEPHHPDHAPERWRSAAGRTDDA